MFYNHKELRPESILFCDKMNLNFVFDINMKHEWKSNCQEPWKVIALAHVLCSLLDQSIYQEFIENRYHKRKSVRYELSNSIDDFQKMAIIWKKSSDRGLYLTHLSRKAHSNRKVFICFYCYCQYRIDAFQISIECIIFTN